MSKKAQFALFSPQAGLNWKALLDREWVRVEREHLTLIGDGVFYTPLVQGLLAADRVAELRRNRVAGAGSGTETLREVG